MEQSQIQNTDNTFVPTRIRLATVVFRTLSGIVGGTAGSAIMFLLFILAETGSTGLFGNSGDDTFNPMLMFTILAIGFLCTQVSALISTALFALCQRDKYDRLTTILIHVFSLNLLFFILLSPLYITVVAFVPTEILEGSILYLVGLHVFLSTMASTLIMEIVAEYRYAILGVYSVSLAIISSVLIMFFAQEAAAGLATLLMLLPVCWASAGIVVGVVEMIYWWMYDVYGADYLNLATRFGNELGGDDTEENEEIFTEDE